MTAGSEESQTAAPYGRALWDADKKSRLFAAVVKTTEMAKGAGLLERTKDGKSEQTLRLYARLARSRVDVTTADGGRLMDGVTAQSWHTVRAAVLHQLAEEYRSWRKWATGRPTLLKRSRRHRPRDRRRSSSTKCRRWSGPLVVRQSRSKAGRCPRCRGKSK